MIPSNKIRMAYGEMGETSAQYIKYLISVANKMRLPTSGK